MGKDLRLTKGISAFSSPPTSQAPKGFRRQKKEGNENTQPERPRFILEQDLVVTFADKRHRHEKSIGPENRFGDPVHPGMPTRRIALIKNEEALFAVSDFKAGLAG